MGRVRRLTDKGTMQTSKVTIPWTVISLIVSVSVGLFLNYRVEAAWISPVAMVCIMGGLIGFGRIPPRGRHEHGKS